ncbi:GGDEF domain-containing protein [Desulfobaculum xiamenense]|uniref:diguanylate cyclase n=1 Tax=Desulfobaculum xiamenense TaxID=995050 RepID=A0A846QLT9_9BACT|nr:GGDEF domain-containing protein [Desulfobaculum xiamenense]NJB67422.1 GGDEF domain-containing protein [Desulfobaculum xiamenense]
MRTLVNVLIFPIACLVGTAVVVAMHPPLPSGVLAVAPYVLAGIGALLCGRFKRSRGVFALAFLVCGFAMMQAFFAAGIGAGALGQIAYPAYAISFPLMLVLLGVLGDRGVFTAWGAVVLAMVSIVGTVTCFAVDGGFGIPSAEGAQAMRVAVAETLHARLLPQWADAWTWLPQPALLAVAVAAAFFIVRGVVRDEPLDAGFAGCVVGVAAGMHVAGRPDFVALFFCAAAGCIVVPLFQDSYRMAFLDELTGLPSRRALVADFRKLGGRYAVAMGDVDHFKKFNDTYGHDVGDEVLRMVASRLARVTGGGAAYRYGGEEFTILFPRGNAQEALPHLDAVRAAIEGSPFAVRSKDRPAKKPKDADAKGKPSRGKGAGASAGKTVSVTISIGLAERTDARQNPEDVLKEADKALYKAKKKGRNQVCAG